MVDHAKTAEAVEDFLLAIMIGPGAARTTSLDALRQFPNGTILGAIDHYRKTGLTLHGKPAEVTLNV